MAQAGAHAKWSSAWRPGWREVEGIAFAKNGDEEDGLTERAMGMHESAEHHGSRVTYCLCLCTCPFKATFEPHRVIGCRDQLSDMPGACTCLHALRPGYSDDPCIHAPMCGSCTLQPKVMPDHAALRLLSYPSLQRCKKMQRNWLMHRYAPTHRCSSLAAQPPKAQIDAEELADAQICANTQMQLLGHQATWLHNSP
eukprot:1161593-Pelagomonas_calceolata.AAC.12